MLARTLIKEEGRMIAFCMAQTDSIRPNGSAGMNECHMCTGGRLEGGKTKLSLYKVVFV